jgi:AcrR family transcriptional regulator
MTSTTRRTELRQQRRDSRQRILDAASQLLEERRWPEVRLEDVMSAAGLSRTAFYRHFDDRHTLLLAMLEEILHHIGATGADWKEGRGEPVAMLCTGLGELTAAMRQHGRLVQAVADASAGDAEMRAARRQLLQEFSAVTSARIRADVEAGRSRVRDPEAVADALVRMNESLLLDAFGQPPYPPDEAVTATMCEVWVSTVYGRDALDACEPAQRST